MKRIVCSLFCLLLLKTFEQRAASQQNYMEKLAPMRIKFYGAIRKGDLKTVQDLAKQGAILDDRYYDGDSLLMFAAGYDHLDIVKWLVEQNVTIDARSRLRSTPLIEAVRLKNLDMVQYLIEHGAKINVHCLPHSSPLHFATLEATPKIGELLLDKGAEIEDRSSGQHSFNVRLRSGQDRVCRDAAQTWRDVGRAKQARPNAAATRDAEKAQESYRIAQTGRRNRIVEAGKWAGRSERLPVFRPCALSRRFGGRRAPLSLFRFPPPFCL